MYWTDYLSNPEEASNLDWDSIGGTWGAATSKLGTWQISGLSTLPDYLFELTERISKADNKSSNLMANYVLKYFDDMYLHLISIFKGLKEGGTIHYIIGNANFYGVTVLSETIYKDLLERIGFSHVKISVLRKRNSKRELFEYVVSASKQ
jgi:hypothetical protein